MQSLQELDAIYQKWERHAIDKGRAEGRVEGRAEGQRMMLLNLLAQRFGDVPSAVRERIETADDRDLQRWSQRIIPARSIAEVFL